MTVAARHYGMGDLSAPVRDRPSIRAAPEWWDTHTLRRTHAAFQTPHNITVLALLCIMCHSRALYLMTLSIHTHTSLNVNYTWPKGTGRRTARRQDSETVWKEMSLLNWTWDAGYQTWMRECMLSVICIGNLYVAFEGFTSLILVLICLWRYLWISQGHNNHYN